MLVVVCIMILCLSSTAVFLPSEVLHCYGFNELCISLVDGGINSGIGSIQFSIINAYEP